MYDIFFIGTGDNPRWRELKSKFVTAKQAGSFESARKQSLTSMFWIVTDDVLIADNWQFDYIVPEWDQKYVHVFLNSKYHDGISLHPKNHIPSKKEIENGFYVNRKQVDIVASNPGSFDIVFISYNETHAETHYKALQQRFPHAKRVHGVKGIHQAHIESAKLCDTDMFWVVDADAVVLDDFGFDYQVPRWERDMVHVWRSRNPVTGMEYGYGGVKLLPTNLTLKMDTTSTDMTTSISSKFKAVPAVSNITRFNTDAFSTWRSAFRECVKLAVNDDSESLDRLEAWLHPVPDADFRHNAKQGAVEGRAYGLDNVGNSEALARINDFDWLKERYESRT